MFRLQPQRQLFSPRSPHGGTQPGSAFRYQYGGRVNDTSTSIDGRNVVIFRNDSSGAIASTYSWWSGGARVDSDVILYDGGWRFFTGASGCVDGVYVEDVATHELGHSLGLAHSAVADATMYSTYTRCSTSMRTLASDDLAGLQLLYPGTGGSSSIINSDTFPGAQLASSLDGTTVPNATRIVDTTGAIWTIGPNLAILRNGVQAAGGWGSQMVWTSHTLYVLGTDNNWYQWTGSSWTFLGPTGPGGQLASRDGTTVPHATQIVDTSGAIWTIGPNFAILRNGVQAAGGWGSQMVWTSHTLYVLGTDNNWYQWTGSSWTFLGPTGPGGQLASQDGTTVPHATQIVDTSGAILDHRPESRHPPEWCPSSRRVGVADGLDESHPLRPRD